MNPLSNIESPGSGTRSALRVISAALLVWAYPGVLLSQAPAPAAPVAPTGGRSLTLEYVVVVVMIGLALFAVCRSSRRN